MHTYFMSVLAIVGTILGLLFPFVLVAVLASRGQVKWQALLLFAVFFMLDIALVYLYTSVQFIPDWGRWNWQGKILEIAWPLLLVALVPAFTARSIGLQWETEPGSWRIVFVVSLVYAVCAIPLMIFALHWRLSNIKLPTLLYEATMPGLGEELVYRGVLLMLLNRAFGKSWTLFGARVGWGYIIVTLLFAFLHGVQATSFHAVHIHWGAMIFPLGIGAVLAWLRERTGSLWPGVVFHNLVNTLSVPLL